MRCSFGVPVVSSPRKADFRGTHSSLSLAQSPNVRATQILKEVEHAATSKVRTWTSPDAYADRSPEQKPAMDHEEYWNYPKRKRPVVNVLAGLANHMAAHSGTYRYTLGDEDASAEFGLHRHPNANDGQASPASVKAYDKLCDRATQLEIDLWDASPAQMRVLQDYVLQPTADGRKLALEVLEGIRSAINAHPDSLSSVFVNGFAVTRLSPVPVAPSSTALPTLTAVLPAPAPIAQPASALHCVPPTASVKGLVQGRLSFAKGGTAAIVLPSVAAPDIAQAAAEQKLRAAKMRIVG